MKKKFLFSITAASLGLFATSAVAESVHGHTSSQNQIQAPSIHASSDENLIFSDIEDKKNRVRAYVGVNGYQNRLSQDLSNGNHTSDKTNLYAILGGVDVPITYNGDTTLRIEGLYTRHSSNYSGALPIPRGHLLPSKKIRRENYAGSATLRHNFEALGNTILGAGVEYRYFSDDLMNSPIRFDRKTKSTWVHLTAEKSFDLSKAWLITPEAKVSYLVNGTQSFDVGPVSTKFDLDKGHGFELGLGFTKTYSNHDVTIKPYYRYTRFKDSKASNNVVYPSSTIKELGLQLRVTF